MWKKAGGLQLEIIPNRQSLLKLVKNRQGVLEDITVWADHKVQKNVKILGKTIRTLCHTNRMSSAPQRRILRVCQADTFGFVCLFDPFIDLEE